MSTLSELGLGPTQRDIYHVLEDIQPATARDIADQIHRSSPSAVAASIDRMKKRGIITATDNGTDPDDYQLADDPGDDWVDAKRESRTPTAGEDPLEALTVSELIDGCVAAVGVDTDRYGGNCQVATKPHLRAIADALDVDLPADARKRDIRRTIADDLDLGWTDGRTKPKLLKADWIWLYRELDADGGDRS